MFKRMTLLIAAALIVVFGTGAQSEERPRVDVDCKKTEQKLVYACVFSIKGRKSGDAIEGAEFKVSADMPSMAMAHNVRSIRPKATDVPGKYHGKLHLEMTGEWALKMEFKKPVRDVVVKKLMFGAGAAAADHGKMDHSKHGKHKMHGKAKKTH